MATVRYLVEDVDASLAFYRALGFRLTDRWGPPFAIVKRKGLALWLSGPGTSAAKKLADGSLPQPGGLVPQEHLEHEDVDVHKRDQADDDVGDGGQGGLP